MQQQIQNNQTTITVVQDGTGGWTATTTGGAAYHGETPIEALAHLEANVPKGEYLAIAGEYKRIAQALEETAANFHDLAQQAMNYAEQSGIIEQRGWYLKIQRKTRTERKLDQVAFARKHHFLFAVNASATVMETATLLGIDNNILLDAIENGAGADEFCKNAKISIGALDKAIGKEQVSEYCTFETKETIVKDVIKIHLD